MSKAISKDGTTIAFDKIGAGPTVILVDGALCYRGFGPMGALAPHLAPHFTVITYDRRGRGESGNTLPYAVEREVEDIEALINEAGGSAFVYGISSGGALAIHAASRLPAIKKVAIYEVPYSLEAGRSIVADYTIRLNETLSEGRRGDAVAVFMKRVGTPDEAIAGMRHAPMWPTLEAVAPTLAYDNGVMGDGTVPAGRAAAVKVPMLVLDGGASPTIMREAADAIADSVPGAQRRTLEGQTHEVAAEAIAPVLVEFFAS
jgi:pimeloyl-ACP methyl ester carboxylesterase